MDSWEMTEQRFYELSAAYKSLGGSPVAVGPALTPDQAEELLPLLEHAVKRGKPDSKLEQLSKQRNKSWQGGAATF